MEPMDDEMYDDADVPEANAAPKLSFGELRHVLSNPERFGLKEMVWYATDAPQWFVDMHRVHSLAARLGVGADELSAASAQWLTSTAGCTVLSAKTAAVLAAVGGTGSARLSSTPTSLSVDRSDQTLQLVADAPRSRLRIRWLLFGMSGARWTEGCLARTTAHIWPWPLRETLDALAEYRAAVAAAPAAAAAQAASAAAAAQEAEAEAAAAEHLARTAATTASEQRAAVPEQPKQTRQREKRRVETCDNRRDREARQQERNEAVARAEAEQAEAAAMAAASDAADAAAKAERARADAEAIAEHQREREAAAAALAQQEEAAARLADARRVATEAAQLAAKQAMARQTVRQIFQTIAPNLRIRDASGSALPAYLLDTKFLQGYDESSTLLRRRMLAAASALMHAVLAKLAPLPLATARQLADPPKRSAAQVAADPFRNALMGGASSSKRRFMTQLASSGVVQSLVVSFSAAEARKATTAEKAQILAPLTASFTLRLFNEIFRPSPMSPLTRYMWQYGQWHERVFLAAQTPIESRTQRWRLKGSGPGGTAPHAAIVEAVDFLTSETHLQHTAFGTRRVRMSDGRWVEFPATERIRCAEALWRLYAASFGADGELTAAEGGGSDDELPGLAGDEPVMVLGGKRLSRSHFLRLANLAAKATQKSYGALDTFSEHNGRRQFELLSQYSTEFTQLANRLVTEALLPLDAAQAEAQRTLRAAIEMLSTALHKQLDASEQHIKRGYASHMPGCGDPEPAADAPTCPEHCRACAFGATDDDSRPTPCKRRHTHRCAECASVHALQPNFELFCRSAETMLKAAEQAASEAVAAAPADAVSGANSDAGSSSDAPAAASAASTSTSEAARTAAATAVAAAATQQAKVREARIEHDELVIAINRSLQKVKAFAAHERRAAHEANVMQKLLQDLTETGCVIVADWKMKFLSASFREAMSDFFGKAGMLVTGSQRRPICKPGA